MQSNEGDEYVTEMSVSDNSSNELFNSRKSVMITDSSNGSFQGGQIQFDLSTLASQSSWASLNEAVIEFPIKITATVTTAGTAAAQGGLYSSVLKNGFHQWIDAVQLVINGQTVQSSQTYENVAAQFRILSQWSQDTVTKYGSTVGFALDDMSGGRDAAASQTSIANVQLSTLAPAVRGLDTINPAGSAFRNSGASQRARMYNQSAATADTMRSILGGSIVQSGQANVGVATSNTVGASVYSQFVMATVRLADLCDISQFPLVKNLRGYLYLTCNQFDVGITNTTASAVSYSLVSGRTNPFMVNFTPAASGITPASGSGVTTFRGRVDGTPAGAVGDAVPVISVGRFVIPTYEANPTTDAILTRSAHEFRTLDKLVMPFNVKKGESINQTITVGIPNATRLVLLPLFQNLVTGGGDVNLANPEWTAFDAVPATSSPFAYLRNFQVQLGGKSVFNSPIDYDFEAWMAEISQTGKDGGQDERTSSGLLSQAAWSLNHRYYTVDLSRRLSSEDRSSKSVQVSFTNGSTAYDMRVIAIVFYEKTWIINTATCALQNVA
jgi:hypothetical protein